MSKRILAIETSCDETALAIVDCNNLKIRNSKLEILSEVVASQVKTHRPYGGVVPALAKREHLKNLPILFKKIKNKFEIDSIAVTVGPGLEPCLWTGINFANDLGKRLKVPVVGVNHLEGHIFSNWINPPASPSLGGPTGGQMPKFPAIVLIVSGGHTILLLMTAINKWKKLGETRDDAAGEAFDKVAKMLELPYPGGPEVERLAQRFQNSKFKIRNLIPFPRPMINAKNYDFSFSGLKTSVLYYLRDNPLPAGRQEESKKKDVCASFQEAAIDVLTSKTMRAAKEFKAKSVLLCGGVACNQALRKRFEGECKKIKAGFSAPPIGYNTDNAVMIAAAAFMGKKYPAKKALPNLNL